MGERMRTAARDGDMATATAIDHERRTLLKSVTDPTPQLMDLLVAEKAADEALIRHLEEAMKQVAHTQATARRLKNAALGRQPWQARGAPPR